MATDHNFVVKNGLEVGGALIVNSSGQLVVATVSSNIKFQDNVKAQFGASSDLQIYHDGGNSYIDESGTGNLILKGGGSILLKSTDNENMITATGNSAVTLYYDGSSRLTTTSTGIQVDGPNGNVTIGAQNTGGLHIYTDRDRFYFNKRISLIDNTLTSYSNNLLLQNQGATKLTLTSTGIDVTGNVVADGGTIDGTFIVDGGTGVDSTGVLQVRQSGDGNSNGIAITSSNATSHRIWKSASGVLNIGSSSNTNAFQQDLTGNITVEGTISSGSITAGNSSTAATLRAHYSDGSYMTLQGYGLEMNRTSSYIRPTTDGDKILYIGGSDDSIDWNSIYFRSNNGLFLNGTQFISSGLNLTNIGTISSGAITSTGAIQGASFSDGTISGITFIDEDSFATNSATRVPTQQSIKAYVDAQVAGVVDSAPGTLDTLNELAAALGDDANFSTTTSTALGNRLRVDTAAQGLTGTQQANAITNLGITATKAELNYVDGVTSNIQTQLDGKQPSGSYLTGNQTITLSGDVSGSGTTSIAVTIADDSHNHVISNVDGLQTALDAKLTSSSGLNASNLTSGTVPVARLAATVYPGSATELSSSQDLNNLNGGMAGFYYQTANADTTGNNYPEGTAGSLIVQKSAGNATQLYQTYQSDVPKLYFRSNYTSGWGSWQRVFADNYHPNADKWTTARTITLGGDLTGNVSIDGSANVTLTATIADDSHNHVISNVDGLQTALDAKLTSSSGLNASNLTSGTVPDARIAASSITQHTDSKYLRSDVSDVYAGRTLSFGIVGNGTNTNGSFFSIEGNVDSSGEGTGRIFFREHNSSTAAEDNFGMSFGYRGGPTNITTAGGSTNQSAALVSNGEWFMVGHDASNQGALIMYGDRAATFVNFASNNITGVGNITLSGTVTATGGNSTQWNTAYGWGNYASAPNAPSITSTTTVNETIEIVFAASTSTGNTAATSYEVWSDGGTGSDYSLIAKIPETDIASSMSVIDSSFDTDGTIAYRIYAIRHGAYSTAATTTHSFTMPSLDVSNMSVIPDINNYHIQYDLPDTRFLDHIEIYVDAEAASGNLTRVGANLAYSGDNPSFTYNISSSDLDKYHQFWVEVVTV